MSFSSVQASSSLAAVGSAIAGKVAYDAQCLSCHGLEGASDVAAWEIDLAALKVTSWGNMKSYIQAAMPKGEVADCGSQCALDITAYMATWAALEGSSSSLASIANSSSPTTSSSRSSIMSSSANASSSSVANGEAITSPTAACPERVIYGPRQLRLLTAGEYQNSLEDLVGIDFDVRKRVPTDDSIEDFDNNVALVPNPSHIDSYLAIADDVSAWSKGRNFAGLSSCDTQQTSCQETFVREFAPLAFRRPITDEEVNHILSVLADDRLMDGDNQEGIRLLMMSVLTSQHFLFRSEQGQLVNDPGPTIIKEYTDIVPIYEEPVNGLVLDGSSQWGKTFTHSAGATLLEITGIATALNGEWPRIEVQVAPDEPLWEFDLIGDGEKVHQLYFYQGRSYNRKMSFRLVNHAGEGGEARTFTVNNVKISNATEASVTVIPYTPTQNDIFILTPYEIASYLSYNFTGSMPDAALRLAAEKGELETQEQVAAQIDRLLATERGAQQLERFADQWLGTQNIADGSITSKDPALFPDFNQDIRDALAQEVREMFKHNVLSDAPFSEFFNSNTVHANKTLTDFYGLNGATGDTFTQVTANSERGGLLTTGAFLGTYSHPDYTAPIIRAVRIRERLMCQYLPDPPNNLDLERAESEAALTADWEAGQLTSRDYFGQLTGSGICANCHNQWINPLGFALEDYDAIGQYRTNDRHNLQISATGAFFGEHSFFDDDSTPLNGGKSLSAFLAASERTDYCLTEKIFRFMNATGPDVITRRSDINVGELLDTEVNDYSCAVQNTSQRLSNTQDIKDVFKLLGTATLVRYRKERNR